MSRRRFARGASILLSAAVASALAVGPVSAEEAGADTGELTVIATLIGPVDARDGFLIVIECADEWCDDETVDPALPDGKIVIFCGPDVADAPTCAAESYEFAVQLQTGEVRYHFVRIRDLAGDAENQLQHSGSWQLHGGEQTLALGYRYAEPASDPVGPTLPDTAMSAP